MELWSVQIGERSALCERGQGLERLHVAPLLVLHRRRVVTFAGLRLAESFARRMQTRFPGPRIHRFPGGPEDSLVVADAIGADEVLEAYGVGPRVEPETAAGAAVLAWAALPGDPLDLPPELPAARGDGRVAAALRQRLSLGQVRPPRAYAAIGALGRPEGLDFMAWALTSEGDFEFGAKYGFNGREALAGVHALAPDVAVDFAGRALWGKDHPYGWNVVEACVARLLRLGEPGLEALGQLRRGHRMERHIRRWINAYLRGTGQRAGDAAEAP